MTVEDLTELDGWLSRIKSALIAQKTRHDRGHWYLPLTARYFIVTPYAAVCDHRRTRPIA